VDTFLHELMEKHVAGQGDESSPSVDMDVMVQTFGSLVQGLKADISRLEADKQDLASQMQVAKIATDKSSVGLASSREKWRETKDELEDVKGELEESRLRISEVSTSTSTRSLTRCSIHYLGRRL
jgi:chromosome segregation ATPase